MRENRTSGSAWGAQRNWSSYHYKRVEIMDILQINEINKITRMDKFIYRAILFLPVILIPELAEVFGYDDQPNIRRLLYFILFICLSVVGKSCYQSNRE